MSDSRTFRYKGGEAISSKGEQRTVSTSTLVPIFSILCRTSHNKKIVYIHNDSGISIESQVLGSYNDSLSQVDLELFDLETLEVIEAQETLTNGSNKKIETAEPFAWISLRCSRTSGSGAVTFNAYFRSA